MCLAAEAGVVVAAAKLLLVRWDSWHMYGNSPFLVICRVIVALV